MNFGETLQYLGTNIWTYGGSFVLVLGILVFVHEWGHYIVARMCGVRVEIFSIGFGKKLLSWTDKKGTLWKLSLIPLGGFVKLFGDSDPASVKHESTVDDGEVRRPFTPEERAQAFFTKPVWKRALVVVAGPAINYIFAIIVLACLYTYQGQPITPPEGAAIIGNSSAAQYGFQPHDMVVSIDGKKIDSFEDIRREMMIGLDIEKHFVVKRGDKEISINAKPKKLESKDRFGFTQSRGMLGLISPRHAIRIQDINKINGRAVSDPDQIRRELANRLGTTFTIGLKKDSEEESDSLTVRPLKDLNAALSQPAPAKQPEPAATAEAPALDVVAPISDRDVLYVASQKGDTFVKYNFPVAIFEAGKEAWHITTGTVQALGQIVTGTRSAKELGGVIRIGALAGDMAQQGIVAIILFTALLSINLGLINLFPIPLLDGGHLVFYALEAILGRPVPERIQEYAFRVGLAFLVAVMVFANLNDIMQLIL